MLFVTIVIIAVVFYCLNSKEKIVYTDEDNYISKKHNYFINFPTDISRDFVQFYFEKNKNDDVCYYNGPGYVISPLSEDEDAYLLTPTKIGKHYFESVDRKDQITLNIKINKGKLFITDYSLNGTNYLSVTNQFSGNFTETTSIDEICMNRSFLQFRVNCNSFKINKELISGVEALYFSCIMINRLIERQVIYIDLIEDEIFYHFNCTFKELVAHFIDILNKEDEKSRSLFDKYFASPN